MIPYLIFVLEYLVNIYIYIKKKNIKNIYNNVFQKNRIKKKKSYKVLYIIYIYINKKA